MTYKIFYDLESQKKDYDKIPTAIRDIIRKTIEKKLTIDPVKFGKLLRYSLKGDRRLRIGDYRVIYKIEENRVIVIIVDIDHRKDIYEND